MELLIILFKVNISLLIFYLVYRYVLRKLTFYNFNRIYLISGIIISAILPLLQYSTKVNTEISSWQEVTGINPLALIQAFAADYQWKAETILQFIYWSGVLVMGSIFLIQLFSLIRLYFVTQPSNLWGYSIRLLPKNTQPFSFFKTIFIHPSDHSTEELESILQHESVHTQQWHSLDILLGEIKRIFCWFNPAAWLMLSAIRENVEFIADRKVLESGMDAKAYQYSLLSVQQSSKNSILSNHFNFSHLKLRITMMNKKKSSEMHLVKYLLAVPVIALASLMTNYAHAQQELKEKKENSQVLINGKPYNVADLAKVKTEEEFEAMVGLKKEEIKTIEIRKANPNIDYDTLEEEIAAYHLNKYNEFLKNNDTKEEKDNSFPNGITIVPKDEVQFSNGGQSVSIRNISHIEASNPDLKNKKAAALLSDMYNGNDDISITLSKINADKIEIKESELLNQNNVIYFLDGKAIEHINIVHPQEIESITVLKGASAKTKYTHLKDGQSVIEITSKEKPPMEKFLDLADEKKTFKTVIYPNPTYNESAILNVNSEDPNNTYQVYDRMGNLKAQGALKKETKINTSLLPSGTYYVKMNIEGTQEETSFQVIK